LAKLRHKDQYSEDGVAGVLDGAPVPLEV
jgi:hypothetical protein